MSKSPEESPIYDSKQSDFNDPCKENGIMDEAKTIDTISTETDNHEVSDKKSVKISIPSLIQNNVISHELQETVICDSSSTDPLDCDSESLNNNCVFKSNINSNETDNKSACYLNGNKMCFEEIENFISECHKISNMTCSDNSLQIIASGSNSEKKLKKDINCKLEFCKPKDESDLGEKRVIIQNHVDVDSEEESSSEENGGSEDFDNSAYNTEIQDVLLQVPKSPVDNLDSSRRSSLKRKLDDDSDDYGKVKKRRKNIQFDGVTVFYFPRSQGFNCVPSQGGSTLGMSRKHFCIKRFSLTEHAAEQKRAHKEQILQSKLQQVATNKRGSCSSSEESEDTSDISDSEMEADSFLFLQPLPIRQRRSLLRQAGIRQIEVIEKENCKDIRVSREMCGCQCKVTCYPETCQCAGAGIKCQVDRHNFPCGCTREGCGNKSGRIEFNPIRVRTHFLRTLMRMEIEKRRSQWEHDDRKKSSPSWFLNGPASSYIQSLGSTPALANNISCSHMADSSNVCVSFDINQHENKNTLQHYQEKEDESCAEFSGRFASCTDSSNKVTSSSSLDESEKSKAIIPKVEDLIVPISSCSKDTTVQTSGGFQVPSHNSEKSPEISQLLPDSENKEQNSLLCTLPNDTKDDKN